MSMSRSGRSRAAGGGSAMSVGGVELFIDIVVAIVVAGLVLRQIMSKR